MNVLIINSLYYPYKYGGAEKSVQILSEELVKLGNSVTVVSLSENYNRFEHNGVLVLNVKYKNIYWGFDKVNHSFFKKSIWHLIETFFYNKKTLEIIKTTNPDIVHINNICGFGSRTISNIKKRFPKIKICLTLRDYYYLCNKSNMIKRDNCNSRCLECSFTSRYKFAELNKVDVIIGISQYIIDKYRNDIFLKKNIPYKLIYNTIEKNIKSNNYIKEKNKLGKCIVFGYIGTLHESKGLTQLIQLFNSPKLNTYNWKLLIAGKGEKNYVDTLKIIASDKIEFLGYVDSSNFYPRLNALIVPSIWQEPFGRVVIDGTNYNLPVFVSNEGALLELRKLISSVLEFSLENIIGFIENPIIEIDRESLSVFCDNTDKYYELYKSLVATN